MDVLTFEMPIYSTIIYMKILNLIYMHVLQILWKSQCARRLKKNILELNVHVLIFLLNPFDLVVQILQGCTFTLNTYSVLLPINNDQTQNTHDKIIYHPHKTINYCIHYHVRHYEKITVPTTTLVNTFRHQFDIYHNRQYVFFKTIIQCIAKSVYDG